MADAKMLMSAVGSTDLPPDVRLDAVRKSGAVLYEYVGGSHAYGTSLPTSDRDLRGVFCLPMSEYISMGKPTNGISDDRKIDGKKKNDDLFFTLRRFFELLKSANPNVIEALWIPEDCIVSGSPEMDFLVANRNMFISKACLKSHFAYAHDQIAKARGKNKKVNNPQAKERPKKLDFCRIIPCVPGARLWTHPDVPTSRFPFRQIPLKDMPWVDLKDYHVAAVEHMANAYRLYCYYGDPYCKGVFRGDDMLVCESIPMEDEHARFSGVLLYDEHEYERALKDWKSYWDWIENRNPNRWIDQENGNLTFDQKNMMHCVRLLWSGMNIIQNGEPIVRFTGARRDYLMSLRTGGITDYDAVMAKVEAMVAEMDEAANMSSIPDDVDHAKVEALYHEVSRMAWKRLFGETWS